MGGGGRKGRAERNTRNLRDFPCGLFGGLLGGSKRDHRFTEPGALSSTAPVDFPPSALRLPRTASGDDFDLLASRARCKKDSTGSARADARVAERENVRKLRHDFHTLRKRLGTSLWIGGEGSTEANLT